jgi:hypothetical protein
MGRRDEIEITYSVEDGYAGGSRPHHVSIPLDELTDCETEADIEERIDQCVNDHFRETIGPYWRREQMEAVVERVQAAREAEDAEDQPTA